MNIIIIEDEVQTAWDIENTLKILRPGYRVLAVLDSVEAACYWLKHNEAPDLMISDIQLGDGLAFRIFKSVMVGCPVIFCTAYNEYAIQAFEANGIDYLLKPVNEKTLERSIAKLESMARILENGYKLSEIETLIARTLAPTPKYKTSFLVPYRNQLIPLPTDQISLFKVADDMTKVFTTNGLHYSISHTLESLESALNPREFYRANRQFLVSHAAIDRVDHIEERKLRLVIKQWHSENITVSKARATEFIRWMEDR